MEVVRRAAVADLAALPAIERDAQQRFIDIGMDELAEGGVCDLDYLSAQRALGLLWVAGDPPAGFASANEVDDALYLAELSVARRAGRRGVGTALVDAVVSEAAARGRLFVVLSTFRDVPWNAPLYRRIGFEEIPPREVGPELARIRAGEAARFDFSTRILMRKRARPDRAAPFPAL